ncbi:MAG: PDZ domain-containing protein [Candidatus Eremiobacteraeota bacterium]|nr:PDZ domain-containing protein [Candidatus Eremiobacteraeota bacterium]
MLRIAGFGFALALIAFVALTSPGPTAVVAQEGAGPSFVPQVNTSAASPTPVQTALPNPISRPDDAHGITQTTAPYAQPSAFSPPPVPPALWLSNDASFSVPCEMHGDRVFVSVVVDGRPEQFLLDSAAPFSLIDPSSAPSRDAPVKLHTLQLGELRFNSVNAGVSRVVAPSEAYLGKPADGVLGQELFARYPVKIDFQACALTIFRDAQSVPASPAPNDRTFSIRIVNGQPQIGVGFASGVTPQLVLDTGSDADADITQTFLNESHLAFISAITELRRWVPGGLLNGDTARTTAFVLGAMSFDRPLIGIIDSTSRTPAGYLGNGFLRNFTVLLNEPALQLTLTPVAGLRRSSYDRSGAWLIWRNGAVTVKSVIPESPASKLLSPGDRIIALNGQVAFDLDGARTILAGPAGSSVAMTYEHGGRQREGSLVLKSLL